MYIINGSILSNLNSIIYWISLGFWIVPRLKQDFEIIWQLIKVGIVPSSQNMWPTFLPSKHTIKSISSRWQHLSQRLVHNFLCKILLHHPHKQLYSEKRVSDKPENELLDVSGPRELSQRRSNRPSSSLLSPATGWFLILRKWLYFPWSYIM